MKKGDLLIIGFWAFWFFLMFSLEGPAGIGISFFWVLPLFFWALIDIAGAKRDTGYKLIWALICFFVWAIGPTLYYFLEVRKRT